MLNVFQVARYIIEKRGPMTSMKLQKLVYYCQAWSLAWDEVPLFEEEFEAWANGPVCPALYSRHRGQFMLDADFLAEYSGASFEPAQIETISAVLDHYGNMTPEQLSSLTHQERPWKESRAGLDPGERGSQVIDKSLMQDYYGGLIQ